MTSSKYIVNQMLSADYILVENLATYKYLKSFSPKIKAKIITFNPSLSAASKLSITSLDQTLPKNFYNSLNKNLKIYTRQIYNTILKEKKNFYLARIVSDFIISKQNLLVRLHQILKICKKKKLVVIEPSFNKLKVANAINGDLYKVLEMLNNVSVIKFNHLLIDQKDLARDPTTNFWIRLNFESIPSITFRIFVILSNYLYKFYKKNIIYYSHENSLLKGSASKFLFKGFILKKLYFSNNTVLKNNQNVKLISEKKVFNAFIKSILGNSSYRKVNAYLINELNNEISKYNHYKKEAKKILDANVKALLIGTPTSVGEIAAIEVSNNRKIITASFQHGISKEISKDISCISTMFETNIINFYFVYNQSILKKLLENKFNVSENFNVGLPTDMKSSTAKKILNNFKGEILYASTNLYCGNRGIPSRSGASDFDKAVFELDLINNIFKKLPKKVHFKPYFAKRYTGPTIELEKAKNSNNIKIIKDEIDLRYLLKYYKIIITSRATSTIGWCLLSKRPLIYIETIDNRLNKEAYTAFKKNLFFFDTKDIHWKRELIDLLSKPTLEIENIWNINASNRSNFVKKFFGNIASNAEYKCANILNKKMN